MRKLAAAVAVGFAALTANVALACDEKERAEQANQKPAVAEKTQKETKPQQKAKKADKSAEKAAVARADKE